MKPTSNPTAQQGSNKIFFYVLIGLLIFFLFSLGFVFFAVQHILGNATSTSFISASDDISLIEIQGPIYQSDDIVRRIKRFRDSNKKALILRLDSPGGAVAPSQEIYSEILSAREKKKIVVASMGALAASGAYYIASACDSIVADPGTLTGSIGVIAEFPEASGLLKKVGLGFQTIKSGKFKDTGTFDRPMTPQEREYLQETINEVFDQFLDSVIQCRRTVFQEQLSKRIKKPAKEITNADIKAFILPYADGRVITGQKAYELGFVDKLGNYEVAVRLTADLAGIKGEPTVRLDEPLKLDRLLDDILPFSFWSRIQNGIQLEYKVF